MKLSRLEVFAVIQFSINPAYEYTDFLGFTQFLDSGAIRYFRTLDYRKSTKFIYIL